MPFKKLFVLWLFLIWGILCYFHALLSSKMSNFAELPWQHLVAYRVDDCKILLAPKMFWLFDSECWHFLSRTKKRKICKRIEFSTRLLRFHPKKKMECWMSHKETWMISSCMNLWILRGFLLLLFTPNNHRLQTCWFHGLFSSKCVGISVFMMWAFKSLISLSHMSTAFLHHSSEQMLMGARINSSRCTTSKLTQKDGDPPRKSLKCCIYRRLKMLVHINHLSWKRVGISAWMD